MARNAVKNEKKMRNAHSRTWNMARKLKNKENETHKLQDMDMARNMNNVENETQTLFALEYGEKTEKRGK